MSAAGRALVDTPGGVVRYVRMESWRDGVLLADGIPLISGREESDRTARIPERVTLRIPRRYQGIDWSPTTDDDHPLATNGQRLRISLGVGVAHGKVEWIQRGEFLIQESAAQGNEVAVDAVGLLALVDEARLVAPYQPSGTLKSTLRGLVEPGLTVLFSANLTDRAVPSGINYDEDRLGAVGELLAAWPAEAAVTNEGYLYVQPPVTGGTTDFEITSSRLVQLTGSASREGSFNCAVARGTASDGAQVQGVAYVTGGPLRYPGPFSPFPVPEYLASPLLTTVAQAQAAAITRRNRIVRENARPWVVEALPLIYAQPGDVALLYDEDSAEIGQCTVEAMSLPYTAGDGAARFTLVEAA